MAKRIVTAFAQLGDRDSIPDTQSGEDVNYQTGYTAPYEADPEADPTAKLVERDKTNQLFNDITSNIKEWQEQAFPNYINALDNEGVAFEYPKGAIVKYNDSYYISLIDDNGNPPTNATWDLYDPSLVVPSRIEYAFDSIADLQANPQGMEFTEGMFIGVKSIDVPGTENFDYKVFAQGSIVPWRNDTASNIVAYNDRTAFDIDNDLVVVQVPNAQWWKEFNARKLSKLQNEILDTDPAPKIVCVGDSVTEGYDYQSANKIPNNLRDGQVLGADTIAPMQYPERLKYWADYFQFGGSRIASVKNWGYSGDTVKSAYSRFDSLGNPDCDVAIMMFGINDNTDLSINLSDFIRYYVKLIRKYQQFGCGVVLMTSTNDKGGIRADTNNYRKIMDRISKLTDCPLIDTTDMIQGDTSPLYSDGTHLTDEGYNLLALRVYAALSNINNVDSSKFRVPYGDFVHPCSTADFAGYPVGTTSVVTGSSLNNKTTRYLSPGNFYYWLFYCEADVTELSLIGVIGNVEIELDAGLDYNKGPYANQTPYNKFVSYTGSDAPISNMGMILGKGWHTLGIRQISGDSYINGIRFKSLPVDGYDNNTVRTYFRQIGSPGVPSSQTVVTIPSTELKKMRAGNSTENWFFTQPRIVISVRSDGPTVNGVGAGVIDYNLSENNKALPVSGNGANLKLYSGESFTFPSGVIPAGGEVRALISISGVTLDSDDCVSVNLKRLPAGLVSSTYFDGDTDNAWKVKVANVASSDSASFGSTVGNVSVLSSDGTSGSNLMEIDSVAWDGDNDTDMIITLKSHPDAYGRVTISVYD